MTTRRALLVINPDKPSAVEALDRARDAIQRSGQLAGVCHGSEVCAEDAQDADLVVALGGDGTILSLSRRLIESGRPLLGVNFGRVGFLAEYDLETFAEQAPTIFDASKDLPISRRPVIEARVEGEDGSQKGDGCALNEAAVTAGPPFRTIEVALSIGSEPGPTARGDGVLVATPFGSTAYNASAGGPIIVPGTDALAVTPIAAHSLAFRPIVAPKSDEVTLRIVKANQTEHGGTTLVLDGQEQIPLETGDLVRLRIGDRTAPLVRNPEWSYWRTLMDKLHWGAPPSNAHAEASEKGFGAARAE
jgi:NAD+ kinase